MKGRSIMGCTQRAERKNGVTKISTTWYQGWLDENGKLWLTACCGKIQSVKTESVLRAPWSAA